MTPMFRSFFLIIAVMPRLAWSQSPPGTLTVLASDGSTTIDVVANDSAETVAWKVLQKQRGIRSREDLKTHAIEDLKAQGFLPFRRVEVDGVSTTDNTEARIPGMFDKQIKMSYQNDIEPSSAIAKWIVGAGRFVADLFSAAKDLNGLQTDHAKQVLFPISGSNHHIDELVAHSWGTEAVYAAILSGYINPPRKLILVGIPERNYAQWIFLAKYTGIEVHVLGFRTDKVQAAGNAARAAGNFMDEYVNGLPRDSAALEKLWQRRCAARQDCADPSKFDVRKFDYNVDLGPPHEEALWPDDPSFQIHDNFPPMDHDRMLYYQHLAKRGLLNQNVAQLDQFNAYQKELIGTQEDRTFSLAMTEAQVLIKIARRELAERAAEEYAQRSRRAADEHRREAASSGSSGSCFIGIGGIQVCPPPPFVPAAAAPPRAVAPAAVNLEDEANKIKELAVQTCDDSVKNLDHQDLLAVASQSRNRVVYQFDRVMSELPNGCEKEIYRRIAALIKEGSVIDADGWVDAANGFLEEYKSSHERQTPRGGRSQPPEKHCHWVLTSVSGNGRCEWL